MSVATRHARHATALILREGEPVSLADSTTIMGVFDLRQPPPAGPLGSDVGATQRIGHQSNPSLLLRDSDASALERLDTVTVRGLDYRVTDILADGFGLTRVDLMPVTAADTDAARGLHRWQ